MDLGLNGKVAVVTGGSGGIGAAIAETLAAEGAIVAVGYFESPQRAHAVVENIRAGGGSAVAAHVDVRIAASVARMYTKVADELGGVDVLVNCAGRAAFGALENYPEEDWDAVVDTNLKGTFLCCKLALPYFESAAGGVVVNISSLAASTGSYEGGAYAASKAAVNSLTLSLALELAAHNVRVNAVAPGRIATRFRRTQAGPYFDFMLDQTPLKRMGTVDEVARCVAFLASPASSFVTGETFNVTGGLHTVYLNHVTPDANSKLG